MRVAGVFASIFSVMLLASEINNDARSQCDSCVERGYVSNYATAALREHEEVLSSLASEVACDDGGTWRIVASIALVENYFRGPLRRKFEALFAEHQLIGIQLIKTTGPMQMSNEASSIGAMRLRRYRNSLGEESLWQDRSNAGSYAFGYEYIAHLRETTMPHSSNRSEVSRIASRYNSESYSFQSELYGRVVAEVHDSDALLRWMRANKCMERDVFSATPFGLHSKNAPHARR